MSEFVFRSGKHKGKSLALVQKIDPDYVEWIRKNVPKMLEETKPKKEQAVKKEPIEGSAKFGKLEPNTDFLNQKE